MEITKKEPEIARDQSTSAMGTMEGAIQLRKHQGNPEYAELCGITHHSLSRLRIQREAHECPSRSLNAPTCEFRALSPKMYIMFLF